MARLAELTFTKGHGTANDFVIIPDPENAWQPTEQQVAWLCDRRQGIGADGLIRVVPTRFIKDYAELGAAEWFMDYRNSDGSLAEMCGNGARVFARYLLASGLVQDREFVIATRAGLHEVIVHADYSVSVSMGIATPLVNESHIQVHVDGSLVLQDAQGVMIPNPHAVVIVPDEIELDRLDISHAIVQPPDLFPDGVNIEFVVPVGERHLRMRVLERGSGETLSCGTGACAVAWVGMQRAGRLGHVESPSEDEWQVDVPGGTLWVRMVGPRMWLRGPADLVARGKVLLPPSLI